MMLDVTGVFRDALGRWRRDRALLLPIAGLFFFLPSLAVNLLVPDRPEVQLDTGMREAERIAAMRPVVDWLTANAPLFLVTELVSIFGTLAILVLYLGPVRGTVGESLRRALRLLPRFLVVMIVTGLPISIGILTMILLLPALYLVGRLYVAGPVLVAEPPARVRHAIPRSFALSRGNGFALAGMATLVLLLALLSWPFDALEAWLRANGAANPVAMVLVAAASAAASTVALTAMPLLQVALYRSLVARSGT